LVPISTLQRTHPLDLKEMASSRAITPASPKVIKIKAAKPGVAQFGCGEHCQISPRIQSTALRASSHPLAEHIQGFLSGPPERLEKTIMHYKNCLRVIFDHTPIVPQTSKSSKGQVLTSLTPNYLCLQCSTTTTEHDCLEHGNETSHRFCNSFLYQ
jgi:ubiquitin carboxyl-terminal hydrolase 22/27/51